ncbi:hypothetical protein D8S78_06195 [Natrialba swarupiae]|nr:hypothetical protein [Natrialba swarupiae]
MPSSSNGSNAGSTPPDGFSRTPADRHRAGRRSKLSASWLTGPSGLPSRSRRRYLLERQAEVGDRTFDDAFETTASALHRRRRTARGDTRGPQEAAESVFDEPVDGTPRKRIGDDAVWQLRGDRPRRGVPRRRSARERTLGLYSVENTFRALEALQSPEWTDALDRPSDVDDVEEARAAAIEEIESARASRPIDTSSSTNSTAR